MAVIDDNTATMSRVALWKNVRYTNRPSLWII